MNQTFIKKYFKGQCTDKELEQVLDWFQTSQGRAFLREQIRKDCHRLTENEVHFLYPDIPTDEIFNRIQKSKKNDEQGNTKNYKSCTNGRLEFDNEPLWKISRRLEHIYNVKIEFKSDRLKELNLTASFKKSTLDDTLRIIANTLDIEFKKASSSIIWISC